MCFVMLDWSLDDMVQFSLYHLWCPILSEDLSWISKYSVGFISCSLGMLLNCVSNFVLCWDRFETHCIGCTVLLLTKVCTLAFKISWIVRKLYNIQVTGVVLFTFWPLACQLSCWLLDLVSVFYLKNKWDKTCTTFVCFFSILAEVVPQLSKNWFTVFAFWGEPCLVLWCFFLHFCSGEDAVSPLIVVFWPALKFK